jgi:hypothetical protein
MHMLCVHFFSLADFLQRALLLSAMHVYVRGAASRQDARGLCAAVNKQNNPNIIRIAHAHTHQRP